MEEFYDEPVDDNDIRLVCFAALCFNKGIPVREDRDQENIDRLDQAVFNLLSIVGYGI